MCNFQTLCGILLLLCGCQNNACPQNGVGNGCGAQNSAMPFSNSGGNSCGNNNGCGAQNPANAFSGGGCANNNGCGAQNANAFSGGGNGCCDMLMMLMLCQMCGSNPQRSRGCF